MHCPFDVSLSTSTTPPPHPRLIKLTEPLSPEGAETTTQQDDPLEKAEAKKESGGSTTDAMKGEKALDDAIGDKGPDPEVTSAEDDPLEEAEATKEKK